MKELSQFKDAIDRISLLSVTDAAGRVIEVNDRFCEATGFARSDLMGQEHRILASGHQSSEFIDSLWQVIQSGQVWHGDVQNRNQDGSFSWMDTSIVPVLSPEGVPHRYLTVQKDITDRKNGEDLAKKIHARIRTLHRDASEFSVGTEQNILAALKMGGEWFAADGGLVLNDEMDLLKVQYGAFPQATHFLSQFDAKSLWGRNFLQRNEKGQSDRIEQGTFHVTDQDASDVEGFYFAFWLDCGPQASTSLVYFKLGPKHQRLSSSDQDLFNLLGRWIESLWRRARSEKLIEYHKEKAVAASRMSTLGEMAGGIAHEINNPLAIIHGAVSQLRKMVEMGNLEEKFLSKNVERIEKTALRIAKIVQGMRTFARDGENDPFREEVLNSIIEDALSLCGERFHLHNIAISVALAGPEVILECRATQISQVLLNLLNNAHDAVSSSPERWVRVEALDAGELVRIAVIDSGNGISPEIADKVFEPFYTTKPVGAGTGLGLSISKGIIANHLGKVFVDHDAKNTRFVIELPKKRRKKAPQL